MLTKAGRRDGPRPIRVSSLMAPAAALRANAPPSPPRTQTRAATGAEQGWRGPRRLLPVPPEPACSPARGQSDSCPPTSGRSHPIFFCVPSTWSPLCCSLPWAEASFSFGARPRHALLQGASPHPTSWARGPPASSQTGQSPLDVGLCCQRKKPNPKRKMPTSRLSRPQGTASVRALGIQATRTRSG